MNAQCEMTGALTASSSSSAVDSSELMQRSKSMDTISELSFTLSDTHSSNVTWPRKLSLLKNMFSSTHSVDKSSIPNDLKASQPSVTQNEEKRLKKRSDSHHHFSTLVSDSSKSESLADKSIPVRFSTAVNHASINDELSPTVSINRMDSIKFTNFTCIGNYRIIKTIGTGAFSTVKLATDLDTDREVAIKSISKALLVKNQTMQDSVENEINLMKSLNHPNIVQLINVVETREEMCLVLEYIGGGELFNEVAYHFEDITDIRARHIFKQIVSVVGHLHSNLVCHRDIKLENILMDKKDFIKLTDFGFARRFAIGEMLHARCGSEEYTAPEILLNQPYDGTKVDIWAMGVVLFALLCGELPFNIKSHENPKSMYHRIARGEFKFPENFPSLDSNAKILIKSMLQPLPKNRITIPEIINHPWLN